MSTEAPRSSYRRLVVVVALALAVVAAVLAVVGARQAPRVRTGLVDGATAIQTEGAQLVLAPNQPTRATGRLSVRTTPSARATVAERDGRFVVTFDQSLRYGTSYAVSVGPVTGVHTGVTGRLRYTFRTPSPALYTLERSGTVDDGRPDRILRHSDGADRTAFSADTILEYADAGTSLVVSVLADGRNQLVRVDAGGTAHPLDEAVPPGTAEVRSLRADPRTGLFGFIAAASGSAEDRLHLGNIDGTSAAAPVAGSDGRPMDVLAWMPVPGERRAVAQDTSGRIFLVDADHPAAPPTPLGTYGRVLGFVPGTAVLALPDNTSSTIRLLDPLHGVSRTQALAQAPPSGGGLTIQQWPIDGSGSTVVLQSVPGSSGGSYRVALVDGDDVRVVLATEPDRAASVAVCLAPDGEHLAVVVEPTDAASDDYPVRSSRAGVSTFVVGVHGGPTQELDGGQPQWCSSGPTAASGGGEE